MSVKSRKGGSIGVSTDMSIGGMAESASYMGVAFSRVRTDCGMGGSLGRAGRLGRIERHDAGGALWRVWIAITGCRSM